MMGESPIDQHMNSGKDWKEDFGQNSGKVDVERNNYIGREAGGDPPDCCPNWRGAAKAAYNITRDNLSAASYSSGVLGSLFGPPLVDYLMPPLEPTPQEANTYFAAIVLLAIIDPSPAGELNILIKGGKAAKILKGVNSKLPHAVEQGVKREVFKNADEASTALKDMTKRIGNNDFPKGTIVDPSKADRILVPVGSNGMAAYQVGKNGTAKLQTVLIAK